jgi:hypothetical protein
MGVSVVREIFQNMSILAAGNGAALAVGVFTVPVVTRIYLPEHLKVICDHKAKKGAGAESVNGRLIFMNWF